MRLRAKEELTYAGRTWQTGALFDVLERDGLALINRGLAEPFGLEDPSQRSAVEFVEDLPPLPPDLPPAPEQHTPAAAGQTTTSARPKSK